MESTEVMMPGIWHQDPLISNTEDVTGLSLDQ
jgi:hypothetical protein